jgi:hypothetical protein
MNVVDGGRCDQFVLEYSRIIEQIQVQSPVNIYELPDHNGDLKYDDIAEYLVMIKPQFDLLCRALALYKKYRRQINRIVVTIQVGAVSRQIHIDGFLVPTRINIIEYEKLRQHVKQAKSIVWHNENLLQELLQKK